MLFFWLLNYLQKEYNPELFTVEVWDKSRIRERIQTNKSFLNKGIIDKLEFVENAVVSKRFRQLQSFLWLDKYKKYFKVFGGWEVLDESRKFPHNGWNLFLLHHYSIKKKNFILVGWIGTDKKKYTKKLYKYLLPRAKKIICREEWSVKIAKNYCKNNVVLHEDFSESSLQTVISTETQWSGEISLKTERDLSTSPIDRVSSTLDSQESGTVEMTNERKTILINVWPKYFTKENIKKIKKYIKKYDKYKKIFFSADINFDKQFYYGLRKSIPDLQIYDRTKHSLSETLDLFKNCEGWIGSRLHFLYPLKVFKKNFVSISDSDKVKKMI